MIVPVADGTVDERSLPGLGHKECAVVFIEKLIPIRRSNGLEPPRESGSNVARISTTSPESFLEKPVQVM